MKLYKKTHYLPLLSDPNTAALYYNIENKTDIRYLSTCGGGWFWSAENEKSEKEKREFINKLIKIKHCSFCNYKNPEDNFGCDNCGAPLDIEMSFNAFGLPEIITKNKVIMSYYTFDPTEQYENECLECGTLTDNKHFCSYGCEKANEQ